MPDAPENSPNSAVPRSAKRMLRNVLSNWGSYIFEMAVTFFLAPFIVRHLGNTSYGVWTLIVSLTGYLGLLDLGVRGAVTRYVARFHATGEHQESSRVATSALFIFGAAGALAMLAASILSVAAPSIFHLPPEYRTAARLVLMLTGINVAVSLISGIFGGVLVGLQRFDLSNSIDVGISGSRALAVVFALQSGLGITALACIQLVFNSLRGCVSAWLAHRLYPELRIRLATADQAHVKLIFSFSFYAFLLQVSGNLIYYTDTVVIGAFLPVSMITFYVIGGNLVEYSRIFIRGISQAMSPLASALDAQHEGQELQRVLLFSMQAATMVALPIATTFMLRGESFIRMWMGAQYAELSGRVLLLLTPTVILWSANNATAGVVIGIGKHKAIVPVLLAEGLSNLLLSALWVRHYGILGVALGTTIPNLASSLFFWPWYAKRTLAVPTRLYIMSGWIRPAIGIVPFALITLAFERLSPASNLLIFFLQVAAAMPTALLGFWFLCFSSAERDLYLRKLTSVVGRFVSRR